MKKQHRKIPQRASKSARKQRHYDGQLEHHRDGTCTLWVAIREELREAVNQAAAKRGITAEEFMRQAVLWKVRTLGFFGGTT